MRPLVMTISGLISSIAMSFSTKARYSVGKMNSPSWAARPSSFSAVFSAATSAGVTPASGSIDRVMIFSGVSWATASMSMPPSVEATKATRPVSRSTSSDR
jgi:hypothetical protein